MQYSYSVPISTLVSNNTKRLEWRKLQNENKMWMWRVCSIFINSWTYYTKPGYNATFLNAAAVFQNRHIFIIFLNLINTSNTYFERNLVKVNLFVEHNESLIFPIELYGTKRDNRNKWNDSDVQKLQMAIFSVKHLIFRPEPGLFKVIYTTFFRVYTKSKAYSSSSNSMFQYFR